MQAESVQQAALDPVSSLHLDLKIARSTLPGASTAPIKLFSARDAVVERHTVLLQKFNVWTANEWDWFVYHGKQSQVLLVCGERHALADLVRKLGASTGEELTVVAVDSRTPLAESREFMEVGRRVVIAVTEQELRKGVVLAVEIATLRRMLHEMTIRCAPPWLIRMALRRIVSPAESIHRVSDLASQLRCHPSTIRRSWRSVSTCGGIRIEDLLLWVSLAKAVVRRSIHQSWADTAESTGVSLSTLERAAGNLTDLTLREIEEAGVSHVVQSFASRFCPHWSSGAIVTDSARFCGCVAR